MKKPNIIFSIIGFAIGIYVIIESARFPKDVVMKIGPDFYPRILAVMLIFFSALLLITTLMGRQKGKADKLDIRDAGVQRIGISLLITVAYCSILNIAGFLISTFVYLFSMMFLLKRRDYILMVVISIVITALVYIIFEKLLNIVLPSGFFNFGAE